MFTPERLKIAAFAVAAVLLFVFMADWEEEKPDVMVGLWHDGYMKEAPDFRLASMSTDAGSVSGADSLALSDLRGDIVVLNIWATWCAPCVEEMPALVSMQERFRDQGVTFVGLSIDQRGWEVVEPFAARFAVNYPIVLDDGEAADRYEGNTGVPTTYLIDRQGRIVKYMPGVLSIPELASELLALVRSSPA